MRAVHVQRLQHRDSRHTQRLTACAAAILFPFAYHRLCMIVSTYACVERCQKFLLYTLGAISMCATQIFSAAQTAISPLRADIAAGTCGPLRVCGRARRCTGSAACPRTAMTSRRP